MIYEKLIPQDNILDKIDSIIAFSFVYEIVKDKYSDIKERKVYDAVIYYKKYINTDKFKEAINKRYIV